MRLQLQIAPPSPPPPPQRTTVEYFSVRSSFLDSSSRSSTPDSLLSLDLTPTQSRTSHASGCATDRSREPNQVPDLEDPVSRLQRECSYLQIRLTTASRERERAALTRKRPESIASTASSKTLLAADQGTRAPPSSARTPPTAILGFPSEPKSPSTGYNTATEYFSTTTTTRKETGETVTFTRTQVTQVRSGAEAGPSQKPKYERWLPPAVAAQGEQAQLARRSSQRQVAQPPASAASPPPALKRAAQHQPQAHPNQAPAAPQRLQDSRSPARRNDVQQAQPQQPHHELQRQPRHRTRKANRRSYASTTSASAPSPVASPPPLPVPAPGMPGYESPPPRRMKPTELCKHLERSLKEVQELLRTREREMEAMKQQRERLLADREREKKGRADAERSEVERLREVEAVRRELEVVKRERDRLIIERERDKQLERDREKERERERRQERERQTRERTQSMSMRRSRSQAPTSIYSSMTAETETIAHARSLDVFLTKTDSWSGAQVIQAVEDLNAEITHFAASATESCVFLPRGSTARRRSRGQPPPGPQATMVLEEAMEIVPWLGPSLARVLTTYDHTSDPLLVQLALQASVATCCARSLSLFCVGFPAKLDGLLGRVYGQLAVAEPQPTSSRWRALTHRSIRHLYPGLEEYAISELVNTMLKWSAAVFDVSGCSPKDKSDSMTATLRAQLRRIAEAVYKLSLVTREDILSTTFEVVLAECGVGFENATMSNAFSAGHAPGANREGEKVLCTTELGLKCVTRRGKTHSHSDREDGEAFERRMLLQPKVVLEEAVDAIVA